MSNKRDINGGDNQQGMIGTMKHCDWPSPSFPKIRQERRYKLNEENPSPGAKFFLTHAEIQTIKGFQDKFTMPSKVPSWKADLNSIRFFASTIQRCVMSVSSATPSPKAYQSAICRLKWDFCLRGIPISCQVLLLFWDYKGKVLVAPDHRDPQLSSARTGWHWLLLTFALTWHQESGRRAITAAKALSPKFAWGWGMGAEEYGGKRVNLSAAS